MRRTPSGRRARVVVLGAAGRDFHNFNVALRDDPDVEVVAFTAAQIPGIAGRRYPAELAGLRYPHGIPIEAEEDLERLIATCSVDRVIFAYSDVSHEHVMHLASRTLAAGADFELLGPAHTMLPATRPVVAVCAVRTGYRLGRRQQRPAVLHAGAPALPRRPAPHRRRLARASRRTGTPIDRARIVPIAQPVVRVRYDVEETSPGALAALV